MLLMKFQAPEPSGSEEDFEYLLCIIIISMVRPFDPLAGGHLEPGDLHMNKLGKGPLSNATY